MAKIVNFFKVLRNNWKKTTFAAAVFGYGIDYAETEYRRNALVRRYCQEAVKYGDVTIDVLQSTRHVVVLLNPAANKKKAQKEYEKYCAPLLHLAGLRVTVLTTSSDVDSISIANKIPVDAEAVLIAGGDGMVSEVITGLLREKNDLSSNNIPPIGILPIGRTNTLANELYSFDVSKKNKMYRVSVMMEATFSIIRELTKKLNVMEIQNIDDDELKPVYAVNELRFGAFRDAHATMDKYWYFGKFRSYASYVLGSFDRNSPIKANIKYISPCSGCSNCYLNRVDLTKKKEEIKNRRWWHPFLPTFRRNLNPPGKPVIDYTKIVNPYCGNESEITINTVDLSISSRMVDNMSRLYVTIGPEKLGYLEFIKEGWRSKNKEEQIRKKNLSAQKLYFTPLVDKMDEKLFSIDNEEFEMKKISVTLLHNIISVFQSPTKNLNNAL